MTRQVKLAIGLWILLAVAVFSVMFDWQTRVAGHQFVRAQIQRQQQGQPLPSINDGFVPRVREAAGRSAVWLVVIAVTGSAAALAAGRGHKVS
jgi:hypothetical protein